MVIAVGGRHWRIFETEETIYTSTVQSVFSILWVTDGIFEHYDDTANTSDCIPFLCFFKETKKKKENFVDCSVEYEDLVPGEFFFFRR